MRKILLGAILFLSCSTVENLSKEIVGGGSEGGARYLENVYYYDTCIVIDTTKHSIKYKCR